MSDDNKTDLEQRIVECQQKIEELSLSQDDPNSERIIRALQEQIALDSDRVSQSQHDASKMTTGPIIMNTLGSDATAPRGSQSSLCSLSCS
jgi:hypothetical protein